MARIEETLRYLSDKEYENILIELDSEVVHVGKYKKKGDNPRSIKWIIENDPEEFDYVWLRCSAHDCIRKIVPLEVFLKATSNNLRKLVKKVKLEIVEGLPPVTSNNADVIAELIANKYNIPDDERAF